MDFFWMIWVKYDCGASKHTYAPFRKKYCTIIRCFAISTIKNVSVSNFCQNSIFCLEVVLVTKMHENKKIFASTKSWRSQLSLDIWFVGDISKSKKSMIDWILVDARLVGFGWIYYVLYPPLLSELRDISWISIAMLRGISKSTV